MLDIGTRPLPYSIVKLYQHMVAQPRCGGCCGEIEVDLDGQSFGASYMIQAAQYYEYKLGHTPYKACEAFFGFALVLPGAYSFFRWSAIRGQPLDVFFKNVRRLDVPTCAQANEYLAEDRVMCLQIYIKVQDGYRVEYIPEAKAVTDAPKDLTTLLKQRRRWINGSMFGTTKVAGNFGSMISCMNQHPCYRQILMFLYMLYMISSFALTFVIVGATFSTIIIFYNYSLHTIFLYQSNSQWL